LRAQRKASKKKAQAGNFRIFVLTAIRLFNDVIRLEGAPMRREDGKKSDAGTTGELKPRPCEERRKLERRVKFPIVERWRFGENFALRETTRLPPENTSPSSTPTRWQCRT
jgi:hypothetical protein